MKQHAPQFLALVNEAKKYVKEISADDLQAKLDTKDDFVLVDVREDCEWTKGHIPQALHISKGVLERDIEKTIPNLHQEVIVYCSGGFRSILASQSLQKMGYTKVYSLKNGLQDWANNGQTLITD